MLRVYRTPNRIPGRMVLQADMQTWAAVVARVRERGEHALADRIKLAVAVAETWPVVRADLSYADGAVVLEEARRG